MPGKYVKVIETDDADIALECLACHKTQSFGWFRGGETVGTICKKFIAEHKHKE